MDQKDPANMLDMKYLANYLPHLPRDPVALGKSAANYRARAVTLMNKSNDRIRHAHRAANDANKARKRGDINRWRALRDESNAARNEANRLQREALALRYRADQVMLYVVWVRDKRPQWALPDSSDAMSATAQTNAAPHID